MSKLIAIAQKFAKIIQKNADIDALESYPGEDSSNHSKLEAAKKAVIDDISHATSTYYMYQSQYEQSAKLMTHQKYLLGFAKQIQYIANNLSDSENIDTGELNSKLLEIRKQAKKVGEHTGIRVGLAELHSFRLLIALIQDEGAKSLPKLPPPDWVELARTRNERSVTQEADTLPLPSTLRSPGSEIELDSSDLIEDDS